MAKFRVREPSFIDNIYRNPGEVIDFEGTPSANLEPVALAKKGKGKVEEEEAPVAEAPAADTSPESLA